MAPKNRKPKSWLDPTPVGKCCDCGQPTIRTYNSGAIWQCHSCAAAIRAAGSRKELRRQKRIAAERVAPKKPPAAIEPAAVIPAGEPSFKAALNESADPETLKALGNHEAAQAGIAAYNAAKHSSPLAQSIKVAQGVKHAA